MSATTGREIRWVRRPLGAPREEDFELAEAPVREPGAGEILVRNEWTSLDPGMRDRMREGSHREPVLRLGDPLPGWAVGVVERSRHARYAIGEHVLHGLGWRDYATLDPDASPFTEAIEVDDRIPAKAYLGPLGWTGLTSYVGLVDVAAMRPGDVVFVSGGAGAAGGLAVQIAKLSGNRVVASAGSAAKVAFLTETLGADAAFSYRDRDLAARLAEAAPEGVDVYFDNVGGDHLEAAIGALRDGGRVAMCGAISTYGTSEPTPGPANFFEVIAKGLTLHGFIVTRDHAQRMTEFRELMRRWLEEGKIVYPEFTVEGLERAPAGFIAMLAGRNVGKTLVRIA